jgi:hypothetical protein
LARHQEQSCITDDTKNKFFTTVGLRLSILLIGVVSALILIVECEHGLEGQEWRYDMDIETLKL